MSLDAAFVEWLNNPGRNKNRVMLFEMDYVDSRVPGGYGYDRTNADSTLHPVTGLTMTTFGAAYCEVDFVHPTADDGYTYYVWLQGVLVHTNITGTTYSFTGTSGDYAQIAISSQKGAEYSKPYIAWLRLGQSGTVIKNGYLGDWAFVGYGSGNGGANKIYLSSKPWLSETGVIYDDWMVSNFNIEESLDKTRTIGDMTVVNPAGEQNWMSMSWRGYPVCAYYGDDEWDRSDFRLIAKAINGGCKPLGDNTFEFEMISEGKYLDQTFLTGSYTATGTVQASIDYVMSQAGLPNVWYVDIPTTRLNYLVNYPMDENTLVSDALMTLSSSIGAYVRINSLFENVEIYYVDPTEEAIFDLTADDIKKDGLRVVSSIPAYKNVIVNMGTGGSVTDTTSAVTGDIEETIEFDTVLSVTSEAQEMLAEKVAYHGIPHDVWEVEVVSKIMSNINPGDIGTINHYDFSGIGKTSMVSREIPFYVTTIEITT